MKAVNCYIALQRFELVCRYWYSRELITNRHRPKFYFSKCSVGYRKWV